MYDNSEKWLSEITLSGVIRQMQDLGVSKLLFKILPRNANSKNQVYLGSDLSQLSWLPSGEIVPLASRSKKSGSHEAIFHAPLNFYWINNNAHLVHAPDAKLVFYPQYPEVRFSGFLKGCQDAPSFLWAVEKRGTEPNRILVLGIQENQKIIGLTLPPESPAAREILTIHRGEAEGGFRILDIPEKKRHDAFESLMEELCRIHHLGRIKSKRLDRHGKLLSCNSTNCGGYTLEAELGISANGYSEPDFMGWEVKSRIVKDIYNPNVTKVTLFTPEPSRGVYTNKSIREFMREYGYLDKNRADRRNFGGVYSIGKEVKSTGLRMILTGFDEKTEKYKADGGIYLVDRNDKEVMGWDFSKLLDHWKRKHARAVFVPSTAVESPEKGYVYGKNVLIGEGTEFRLFLKAINDGLIVYDPGIKLENISSKSPKAKKRSQFRVSSKNLSLLYLSSREVDVCNAFS